MKINPIKAYNKTLIVPSDKSITHRALMLNAYAGGSAAILNPLLADDCISTMACMNRLGANFEVLQDRIIVRGGIHKGNFNLDAGNSGTTMRLLTGLLSGIVDIDAMLSGDSSLHKRPMNRILNPLGQMGAQVSGNSGFAPLHIKGKRLKAIDYIMEVNSAQVKSCVLLAGLNADGVTSVTETVKSRDHTEIMLKSMGADIRVNHNTVSVHSGHLKAVDVSVPGDISSAAFFMVLPLILKNSSVTVKNVSVNPTRTGIIDILKGMGAHIELFNLRGCTEAVADIYVESGDLRPFNIDAEIMPRLIDEIPILSVLACFVPGVSVIRGAGELRVKESDRIKVICDCLSAIGGNAEETSDGLIISGGDGLKGGTIDSNFDHRIAMSMAIAALGSREGIVIQNSESVSISFPNFFTYIND